jgi:hypothetical protein
MRPAWLDEQLFYEYCQQYRHSVEWKRMESQLTTVEAFEALKDYIALHCQKDRAAICEIDGCAELIPRASKESK